MKIFIEKANKQLSHDWQSEDGFNDSAFKKLSKDIHEASLLCGYDITRNGTNRKIKGNIITARFKCKQCQSHSGNSGPIQSLECKKISHNENQPNKRLPYDPNEPSIKLNLTRTDTAPALNNNTIICLFPVTISYDKIDFYIESGISKM